MRYVMLISVDEEGWGADEEKTQSVYQEIFAWYDKWHAAGKVVDGGAQLDSVRKAKTISRGADGRPVVTDGPFLELKEVIAGIINLDCDDLDEAVAIASTWPAIAPFDEKVEVRPIIQRED